MRAARLVLALGALGAAGCDEEAVTEGLARPGTGAQNETPLWVPYPGFRMGDPGDRLVQFVGEPVRLEGESVLPYGAPGATTEFGGDRLYKPVSQHRTHWLQATGKGVRLRFQRGAGALSDWQTWLPEPVADGAVFALDGDPRAALPVTRGTRGHTPFGLRRIWNFGLGQVMEGRGPTLQDPLQWDGLPVEGPWGGVVPLEPAPGAASEPPGVSLKAWGARDGLLPGEQHLYRPERTSLVVDRDGIHLRLEGQCSGFSSEGIEGAVVQSGFLAAGPCAQCLLIDPATGEGTPEATCHRGRDVVVDANRETMPSPSPGEIIGFVDHDGTPSGFGWVWHPDPAGVGPDSAGLHTVETLAHLATDPAAALPLSGDLGGVEGYPWLPAAVQAYPDGFALLTTVAPIRDEAGLGPFFGWAWADREGRVTGAHTATGGAQWVHDFARPGEAGVVRTSPEGTVEQLLPTREGLRIARVAQLALPEGHALVSALPLDDETLLVVTWTGYRGFTPQIVEDSFTDRGTRWDPSYPPDFGTFTLWKAARPADPPIDLPNPLFGVVAWPLGADVAVCWPRGHGAPNLDPSGWQLGGAAPEAVLPFDEDRCVLLVRGRDAGDLATSEVVGPIPGGGRAAIGVRTRVHRDADFNGVPEHPPVPDDLNAFAPLAAGGFRAVDGWHDAALVHRTPLALEGLTEVGSVAVDATGGGVWVVGHDVRAPQQLALARLGAPGAETERVFDAAVPDFGVLSSALVVGGGALLDVPEAEPLRVTPAGELVPLVAVDADHRFLLRNVALVTPTDDRCGPHTEPNLILCLPADGRPPVTRIWPGTEPEPARWLPVGAREVLLQGAETLALLDLDTFELRDIWDVPVIRAALDARAVPRDPTLLASAAVMPGGDVVLLFAEVRARAGLVRHTLLRYDGARVTEIRAPQLAFGATRIVSAAADLLLFDNVDLPPFDPEDHLIIRVPLP